MTVLATTALEACNRFASRVAIEADGARLSYSDLAARARTLAGQLAAGGMEAAEPVIVLVSNHALDLAAYLGVWLAGGTVVPVHRAAPPAVRADIEARCGARFVVGETIGEVCRVRERAPIDRPLLKGAALVVFTSGSTGTPKGVVLRHDRQQGKLAAIQQRLGFHCGTRCLIPLRITFIFGIWTALLTLQQGGTVLLEEKFDPERTGAMLQRPDITDAAFVPTMLRLLLTTTAGGAPRSAARLLAGGEPLGASLASRARNELTTGGIADIYGLTETGSSDFFLFPAEQEQHPGTIGRPAPGVAFRIRPHTEFSDGTGELQIASPYLMAGYLDDPELTAASFEDGYFRTGDLARCREDGVVELVGRAKELIIKGGNKIAPLELDELFARHPAVTAALATGTPDPISGERVHLAVVLRPRHRTTPEELRAWARERIESYKLPDEIHVIPSLPLGRTGKVDRSALREIVRRSRTA